jgi:hypothetical protein
MKGLVQKMIFQLSAESSRENMYNLHSGAASSTYAGNVFMEVSGLA